MPVQEAAHRPAARILPMSSNRPNQNSAESMTYTAKSRDASPRVEERDHDSNVRDGPFAGRFARRRVLVIRHRGNLANKMLQYMGALSLANRVNDCKYCQCKSIPESGIEINDDTQSDVFFDNIDLSTWDPFRPHIEELCTLANQSQSIRIIMGDHLLGMEFYMQPQFYNRIFPNGSRSSYEPNLNLI